MQPVCVQKASCNAIQRWPFSLGRQMIHITIYMSCTCALGVENLNKYFTASVWTWTLRWQSRIEVNLILFFAIFFCTKRSDCGLWTVDCGLWSVPIFTSQKHEFAFDISFKMPCIWGWSMNERVVCDLRLWSSACGQCFD